MELAVGMRGDILMAKASGELSFPEALAKVTEIMDHAAANQAQKVLIDCLDLRGWLSPVDRHTLGTDVFRHMQDLGVNPRTAVVGTLPEVNGLAVTSPTNEVPREPCLMTLAKPGSGSVDSAAANRERLRRALKYAGGKTPTLP